MRAHPTAPRFPVGRRISGAYEPHGLQDYAAETAWVTFANASASASQRIAITNDRAVEAPDEVLTVRASIPGMVPSPTGRLWAYLTIEDDGDGARARGRERGGDAL